MSYKNKMNSILLILMFFIMSGCSKREYKADAVVGYWQVLQKSTLNINGIPQDPYESKYWVRFLDNNCGHTYNQQEEWASDIKWAFQEREVQDRLLISTALNSNGQSTDLSITSINYIEKFEEMNFLTFTMDIDTIDGDVYSRGHLSYYVRQ